MLLYHIYLGKVLLIILMPGNLPGTCIEYYLVQLFNYNLFYNNIFYI